MTSALELSILRNRVGRLDQEVVRLRMETEALAILNAHLTRERDALRILLAAEHAKQDSSAERLELQLLMEGH